jgi:predicted transcriptional regulator
MSNLTELTAQIIAARAAKKDMSTEELQHEMQMIYTFLKGIESGETPVTATTETPAEESKPQLTIKRAFKKDEVICMICNKGFKTLKRHLTLAHDLKPGEYRKQFNIPSTQSLAAKSYSDSRRQMALDKGLGAGLVKFRASQAAKKVAAVPVEKVKASAPAVKVKAPVPAVKKKAAAPAKVEVVKAPVKSTKKITVPAKLEKKAAIAIAALKKMTKEK